MKYSLSSKKPVRTRSSYSLTHHTEPKDFTRLLLLACVLVTIVTVLYYRTAYFRTPEPSKTAIAAHPLKQLHISTNSFLHHAAMVNQQKQSAPTIFSHTSIMTTLFWVGEPADSDNGSISNTSSAWDELWQQHFGGVDTPLQRNGYSPALFTPHENPFYFALPYNDVGNKGNRKTTASKCLTTSGNTRTVYSWCKNTWIAIRFHSKTVYAQWEDAGPFGEDDTSYVFGSAAPSNKTGQAAGLDVSPAVSTYLGLSGADRTDWVLVSTDQVPAGPWKQVITSTPGEIVD